MQNAKFKMQNERNGVAIIENDILYFDKNLQIAVFKNVGLCIFCNVLIRRY